MILQLLKTLCVLAAIGAVCWAMFTRAGRESVLATLLIVGALSVFLGVPLMIFVGLVVLLMMVGNAT